MTGVNSEKINIALLTDCLADLAGGAEKQIYELAKRLDKSRYNIYVASLDCEGKASEELITAIGAKLAVFRVVRIYGLSGIVQGIRFLRFLKKEKICILQTYHFSSDIWGAFWGKLAGVSGIVSNRRDMGFWRKAHHVWAYRFVDRWVKRVVVVSQSVKKMVEETEGVPETKISVIYNGIELSKELGGTSLREIQQALGVQSEDKIIMHVANLRLVKGHACLLDAAAGVAREFPGIKLALVGKDELNGALVRQAQGLGIGDKVLFLGKREDISQILKAADICVLPSLSEGMSNSILEYMAAGKPVVATRVGGNPELVTDGVTGILVDKENPHQLKEAILKLLKSPSESMTMGENGFDRVKSEFSMERMIAQYDGLFSSLCKRKTLHLVSSGGFFGAEQVILSLAGLQSGRSVFVGALNNTHNPHLELIDAAKQKGVPTVVFDCGGRFDLGVVFRIRNFLVANGIEIIHTHNYKSDILGGLAARLAGKKWVATNHVWHGTDRKLQLYERCDAFMLRFADKVIAVSEEIERDLAQRSVSAQKIAVIHNGIDAARLVFSGAKEEARRTLNLSGEDLVITVVGRLSPEKGHEILLNAAAKVIARFAKAKFLIVGDGPLLDKLKEQAAALGIGVHVIFAGIRSDMPVVYAASDLLVSASFIEGLPMTILESMAAGLPVIATKVGAVPKVIRHRENGILLEPGNPKALAEAIVSLFEAPDTRRQYAKQAYEDVCRRHSVEKMAEAYDRYYGEVLER